ncbi:hypothetical protein [Amycolatopsis coloradensis]|uniref:hypothetical protein n=1 Tax=Amycolatopsis coloradensis TaxID=76021 RepID=UPI001ABF5996|nr:hypothetical protein [Amycolatopsis coloradensis]
MIPAGTKNSTTKVPLCSPDELLDDAGQPHTAVGDDGVLTRLDPDELDVAAAHERRSR